MYQDIDLLTAEELIMEVIKMEALLLILEAIEVIITQEKTDFVYQVKSAESNATNGKHEYRNPGKTPIADDKGIQDADPILHTRRSLYSRLHKAIINEDYEKAAWIRDQLKDLA